MRLGVFFIISIIFTTGLFSNIYAESVPDWVKNTAGWWATDVISETEFVNAIEFLVKDGIIEVDASASTSSSQGVPDWVKNTAGWWATDVISETEFVNAIEFLVKDGIIEIESKSKCMNDILNYFGNKEKIIGVCKDHESSSSLELIPYDIKLKFNSEGFRGEEFEAVKKSNVYRIFMVGGSTMLSAGTINDVTVPSILQKIFTSTNLETEIQVLNVGMSGSNTTNEKDLIKSLVRYDPDLIIMYDGWNDLNTDFPVMLTMDNYSVICGIAVKNDFELIITLQPIAGFGSKTLTEQEKINSLTSEDHNGFQILQSRPSYDYLERQLNQFSEFTKQTYENCEMYDLRGIFDNVSGPIYFDGGHTLHAGNFILAEEFFEISMKKIKPDFNTQKKFTKIISDYNSEPVIKYLLQEIGIENHGFSEKLEDVSKTDSNKGRYFDLKNEYQDMSKVFVGKDITNMKLRNMNLDGQDFTGSNFSGMDLRGIDFTGSIIRNADFSYTNLEGMSFQGLDLRGIDFSHANMKNSDLRNVILGKPIQIVKVQVLDITRCDHEDAIISIIQKVNCTKEVIDNESIRTKFINTNLQNVKFGTVEDKVKKGHHIQNKIQYVDFTNADLTNSEFKNTTLTGCIFNNAILDKITIHGEGGILASDLENITMKDAIFHPAWLQAVSFKNSNIINSVFTPSVMVDVNFEDADLDGTNFAPDYVNGNNNFNCKNNITCNIN